MNETTLNALINLFAIFSAISESKKEEAISKFSQYLELHLGITSVSEYVELFEELLELYSVDEPNELLIDLNQQAETISNNIKTRLHKDEQVMVFLRFLELAQSGNVIKADQVFKTIAREFEIDQTELDKFKAFIFHTATDELKSPDFLLIDEKDAYINSSFRHLQQHNLNGKILFLNSKLIGHYIFIFKGKEDITLEGNHIIPDRFYAFKEGGIIRGQRISPIYYTDIASHFVNEETDNSFLFRGIDIEFKFNNSDNGLHRFSFSESSGQLIAVMGGSGVGKSTLLNILNGNIPIQKGGIFLNQLNIHKNKSEFEGLIGFVPQDDLLFENLSVWENLYYNALLCFSDLTKDEINKKVTKILRELELYAFKDLKVGSPLKKFISGGQRKRLNVALELIREPAIMFVDEPTSGLSSTDSEKVMLLLKQQARKGKLIIVNIHQPSSAIFKLLDKLWILDTGGRPIYTGNPLDAIMYFKKEVNHVNADVCECVTCGNVNPEQVLEIVEAKSIDSSGNFTSKRRFTPQYWYQLYKDRIESKEIIQAVQSDHNPKSATNKPSRLGQFKIFFERNFRVKISDKQYLIINLIEAPILAIIVAYFTRYAESGNYVFFENKSLISYLFMAIVVVLFMGMSVSAEEIIKDRKILQRESFLNLSRLSYLNSKILFLVLLSAFQTFSFVLIGNFILGIHGMNLSFWLILFSVAVFSNMLGLNISSAFDSEVTIYILVPLLLIPQILLCGVIVKFDDLQDKLADKDAVPIIAEFMASRWAFEAMAVEQYKNNEYMADFFEIEKQMSQSRYRSDLLTTELTGQIDLATGWQKLNKAESEIDHKLQIIQNEIKELDIENVLPPFPEVKLINRQSFNIEIAGKAKDHLAQIQKYHDQHFHRLKKKKDQFINKISKSKGSDYLYEQKLKYYNKALEALVLNTEAKNYYRETENGFMQKIAPIYKASDYNNGRAHFFVSEKKVLGINIDTLHFNLAIILFMCTLLYLALYFNWLRKLVDLFGKVK